MVFSFHRAIDMLLTQQSHEVKEKDLASMDKGAGQGLGKEKDGIWSGEAQRNELEDRRVGRSDEDGGDGARRMNTQSRVGLDGTGEGGPEREDSRRSGREVHPRATTRRPQERGRLD